MPEMVIQLDALAFVLSIFCLARIFILRRKL